MPTIPRLIIDGACYHIMTRGNQKQTVFKSAKDKAVFLKILRKYKRKFKINLYGYCLMTNHTHIICQVFGTKTLSKFMHGINRGYTLYFNRKYDKVGHLWQGRFKSKVVVHDKYLVDLITYVEYNPVRGKLAHTPYEYIWSSYRERNLLNSEYKILDELNI